MQATRSPTSKRHEGSCGVGNMPFAAAPGGSPRSRDRDRDLERDRERDRERLHALTARLDEAADDRRAHSGYQMVHVPGAAHVPGLERRLAAA